MKSATKRKIIYWLIKVLKYRETYQPFIIEKRREIQSIHWQHIYDEETWKIMIEREGTLKLHAVSAIAHELEKIDALEIKVEPVHRDLASDNSMRVHAILKFIYP